MADAWGQIIADPEFQRQRPEDKARVAENFFAKHVATDPEFQSRSEIERNKVRDGFMGSIPDLKRSKSVEIAASTLRGFIDIPKGLLSLPSVAYDFPKALAQQAPQILADQATGKSRSKSPWLTDFSQVAGQQPQPQLGPPRLTLPDNGFMQDYENRKPDPGKQLSRVPEIIGRPQKSPMLRPSDNLNPLSWQGAAAIGPQILASMTGAYALSKLGQFGNALGRSKTVFSPVRPGPAAAPGAARVIDRTVDTAETAAEAARARQAFGGIMGSVDAGSQYTDRVAFYKSQGLSDESARQRASLEVAAYLPMSIALEGAGAQGFMGSQPGGLTRRFVAGAIPEAAQEGAQGLAQGLTNYTVSGDQGDLNAIPGDMAVGMVYGAGAGGAMGAMFGQRPRAPQEPSPAPAVTPATAPLLTPAPEAGKPDVKKIETPVAQEAANADISSPKRSEVKPAQRKRLDGKIQVLQESRVSQALRDGGEAGGNIRLDLDGADARDAEWRFAETVGETFGKEVVPFAQDGGEPFNGATDPKVKHTLFINTASENPAQFVVGHELYEAIEMELGRDHTAVEAFKQAVAGAINDPEAYRVYLSESSGTDYTSEGAMREHRADFLGQSIARPEFWQRLADTAPDVFRRTAETFLRLIEKIKATVIGREYDAERWMAESGLEDARRAAARLLVEYRRSGGSRAIPGQVQPLNTGPAGPGRTAKTYGGQSGTDYVYVHPNDTVEHPIKYRLIEADGLKQSNDPQTFAVNKDYPRSLQPRAYESQPAEQAKVAQGALKLDPRRLITGDLGPENGPPVVTNDGVVLAGNSRVMMVKRAADSDEALYRPYREYLAQHAEEYGLTAADVRKMKRPVLVRELQNLPEDQWSDFAARANDVGTAAYDLVSDSMRVAGRMDSRAVTSIKLEGDDTIRSILGDVDKAAPFIQSMRLSGALTPANEAVYVDSQGRLTSVGKDLLENALLAKVFEGPQQRDALEYFEFDRGRRRGVMRALPDLVRLTQLVKDGLPAEYNIASSIYELARAMQEKGVRSWTGLERSQDFVSPLTEEQAIAGRVLADLMEKPIKFAEKIGEYVDYAAAMPKDGEITMMPLSRVEMLRAWSDPKYRVRMQRRRADLADIFASKQEVVGKQPKTGQQPDMFGGKGKALTESAADIGTPSIKGKIGKSTAKEDEPDLFLGEQPVKAEPQKVDGGESQPDMFGMKFQRARKEIFLLNSNGETDWGEIPNEAAAKVGHPGGPIRMERKSAPHLAKHNTESRRAGYGDAHELAGDVAKNFTEVRRGKEGSLLLVKRNGKSKIAFVELVPMEDGSYWRINTAFPMDAKKQYVENKGLLWERAPSNQPENRPPSAISGQSNPEININHDSEPGKNKTQYQRQRFDPERVAEMNARAQAEEEGKRTIGRPELANPAGPDERSRRFVDAVDEIRKEDGIPQRQRDDDVEQAAKELLDRDYKGTKATLLSRANEGAGLTAVETRAAQEIVRRETFDAVKSGDTQALADAAGLADAWRETGTEQARAFRQRRDMFKSPEERAAAYLAEAIVRPDKATQRRLDGAKAESKKDILKQWAEKVKTLKAKLEALGIDTSDLEATAKNPDKGAAAIRAISESRADAWDKLYEYWICSILSAPTTQIANIVGNTASMGWDMTGQRLAEALVNVFVKDKRSARFGELPYIAAGFIPGIARASRNALKAFKHERPVFEEEVMGSGPWTGTVKHELKGPAISGLKGRIIRTPLRALTAMDEFAKSMIGQMQAGAEAYRIAKEEGLKGEALSARIRELVSDLGSDAWQSSIKYAKQLTFQEELGSLGKAVMKARADLPVLGLALPFVKTPANIFKMGIRKSPLGSIGMLARIANQEAISLNWNKSGRWEYSKNLFVRDAAEQLWAWGLTWLMAGLLGDDDDRGPFITGTKPIKETSPGERAAAWRTAPPMSVRIGNRYFSYARIEPLATTLALTIDLMADASEAETGEDWLLALGKVHSHIAAQVREKTFMQAIGDILDAIESPDSAGKWAANFGSSWMPNIIRHSGRSADPYIRETRSWGEGLDRARMLGERTSQKAFPFGENRGMPKVTPWGEEIKSSSVGSPTSDFFFRLLPTKLVDPGDRDPRALNLDRLLTNWNNQHSDDQWWVDVPDPYFTYRDENTLKTDKVWMNDQQYNEFLKEAGKGALDRLSRMKLNVENPTIQDIRLMQRIIDQERQIARRKLFGRAAYEREKEAFMGSK